MPIYEPQEDSSFLQRYVREYAHGRVLDLGTGSGIQALTAAEIPRVREVLAVDISIEAVESLQRKIKEKAIQKITVVQSDLFEQVAGKFNTIIFNPPYLPQDEGIIDSAIYGGKQGWELSARFFAQAQQHFIADGMILFLFSTLTNKEKINELVGYHLFSFEELGTKKLAFETLYVYKITKTVLLRELESKLIENIHFFAQGQRGFIYVGTQDQSKLVKSHFPLTRSLRTVAIKVQRADSTAQHRIKNEAGWLSLVNKKGIGPKLLFSGKSSSGEDYLVYEFVEGDFILNWLEKQSPQEKLLIRTVLLQILEQCLMLDQLQLTKEEMHHPLKHIIITKQNKPVLLDFERCHTSAKPQNVTQYVEFLSRIRKILQAKSIMVDPEMVQGVMKEYKHGPGTKNIEKIKKLLSSE